MAIIGLDATAVSVYGKGVSRYQYNLIKGLAKLDKKNCYYIFLNKKNALPDFSPQENFNYIRILIPKRIIWDQIQLPLLIKKYKLDIYYSSIDSLPLTCNARFVLFLFEIPDYRIEQALHTGNNSLYARLSYGYNRLIFPPSLRKANIIIASSKSTKNDLILRYKVDENKIRVLYPAADECFFPLSNEDGLLNIRQKYNVKSGYILHISSSDPRDNTSAAIYAFQKARRESKINQKLIIAGNVNPKNSGLNKLIKELNLEDSIVFTGYLMKNDLVLLYQAADLYVDPSLYEGFGFQVLEAMSCGIPVITSNVTSLPEIVGDAGILVEPTDIDGMVSKMAMVLTDSRLNETLRQKSLERAKFFSWDKTAQATLAIYEGLL